MLPGYYIFLQINAIIVKFIVKMGGSATVDGETGRQDWTVRMGPPRHQYDWPDQVFRLHRDGRVVQRRNDPRQRHGPTEKVFADVARGLMVASALGAAEPQPCTGSR